MVAASRARASYIWEGDPAMTVQRKWKRPRATQAGVLSINSALYTVAKFNAMILGKLIMQHFFDGNKSIL